MRFIIKEIQKICIESMWRDPKTYKSEVVNIDQINQFINLRLKIEYKEGP